MLNEESARVLMRLSQEVWYLGGEEEVFGAKVSDVRFVLKIVHDLIDWQPIETAPKDGGTFLVYSADSETYDLAEFGLKHGEFIKHGCGWQYATQWADLK